MQFYAHTGTPLNETEDFVLNPFGDGQPVTNILSEAISKRLLDRDNVILRLPSGSFVGGSVG